MQRGSIFNSFARFSRVPSQVEPVCLIPKGQKEIKQQDTRPVRREKETKEEKTSFETEFILMLNRVLVNLDNGDGDIHRILTRVKEVLVRPPVKKQALPYFYHPKYVVEGNVYQIEDRDVTIAASLSAVVPKVILYPFGQDIIANVEMTNFEMTVTDSEGKTGVVEAQLDLDIGEIAFITFDKYYEIVDDGSRKECTLANFTLPAMFSARYTIGE